MYHRRTHGLSYACELGDYRTTSSGLVLDPIGGTLWMSHCQVSPLDGRIQALRHCCPQPSFIPGPTMHLQTSQTKMIPSRLSNLPYDILRHICAVTSERSEDAQRTTVKHPLDGLSRTNKHLREVSVPQLFHTVTIRCDWEKAETSLEALRHSLTLTPYVK